MEIRTGDAWAGISAAKWRSLLAALLVNAGQVVPTDRLIRELWGESPPAGAINLVSIYVLRLRRLIGDEDGQLLRTRAPGYQLSLEPGDLDASRFDELVDDARHALAEQAPDRAAELLSQALGLWRGGALVDVPVSALMAAEADRLEQNRLNALELRIGADISCGRQAQVTPELSRLIADHPLREGFWGLLMQALAGAGRRAEALTTYAGAREVLAEELGVDPGEQLQWLYQRILTADARPAPGQPEPEPVTEQAAAPEQAPASGQAPVPPAQLPADITDFTGRALDVKLLCELQPGDDAPGSPGAVMVGLVTGAGGLGKTTLAVHAAHRLCPRFPDGQLYVDLLGASPQPLAPGDVLARFLRDLGLTGTQIPVDTDERAALLRTRLTGRRVLILLDNARDAAQVRPLLPGSSGCAVLVTARNMLPDLPAARMVDLDVLGDGEARVLFAGIVGAERADAEADATSEVLAACAGLPLAIRIAGARLAARRGWTVRTLAGKLRSEHRLLDELTAGDLAVRACFSVSFASLPGPSGPDGIAPAGAFRLLGLWQGPAVGLPGAAALVGRPEASAADALELLVDAHLLESPAPDRYRFHDLIRVYAAERCQSDEPVQVRRDALHRILTWYLHSVDAAARIISPNHARVPVGQPAAGVRPLTFSSLDQALDWAETERANVVAATRQAAASGQHDIAWRLPAAAMSFFYRRGHWADWMTTHEIGLRSAREIGDRPAEAWMLNNLGMAYGLQRMEQAIGSFEEALAIYREVGDRQGEAKAATNMSAACFNLGRFRAALDAGRRSLVIQREVGNRYGEGIALGDLGCAARELGLREDAISWHQQALAIFRELGDRDAEADSLSELADVYLGLDRVAEALDRLTESLDIRRDIGDRHGEATTLRLLGQARARGGQPDEARASLADAARIFADLGDLDQAAGIRSGLTEITGGDELGGARPSTPPDGSSTSPEAP
jgi:DNA-binding SARP family transcriptional activator/tetratricopeptide (TPR) repeat protein